MSAGQYDQVRALQRRLSTTRPSACTENWRRQFRRLCANTTKDHRTPLVRSVTAWATSAECAAAHSADVAHAVTDLTRGVRWSLVVFAHKRRNWRRQFSVQADGRVVDKRR